MFATELTVIRIGLLTAGNWCSHYGVVCSPCGKTGALDETLTSDNYLVMLNNSLMLELDLIGSYPQGFVQDGAPFHYGGTFAYNHSVVLFDKIQKRNTIVDCVYDRVMYRRTITRKF